MVWPFAVDALYLSRPSLPSLTGHIGPILPEDVECLGMESIRQSIEACSHSDHVRHQYGVIHGALRKWSRSGTAATADTCGSPARVWMGRYIGHRVISVDTRRSRRERGRWSRMESSMEERGMLTGHRRHHHRLPTRSYHDFAGKASNGRNYQLLAPRIRNFRG